MQDLIEWGEDEDEYLRKNLPSDMVFLIYSPDVGNNNITTQLMFIFNSMKLF